MKRKAGFYFLGTIIAISIACQNNTTKPVEGQQPELDTAPAKVEGHVEASANFMMKEVDKKELQVLGKYYEATPESVRTLFIGTANALNEFIEKNKLIIEGSILTIYSEVPSPDKKQKIFVGIPVNKKVKSSNWEYLTLPAGRFHKATTNAEIGATIPLWNTVTENLTKAGYTIKMPIYEYPSDGRNFEMTTTVSQVNLLIPVVK